MADGEVRRRPSLREQFMNGWNKAKKKEQRDEARSQSMTAVAGRPAHVVSTTQSGWSSEPRPQRAASMSAVELEMATPRDAQEGSAKSSRQNGPPAEMVDISAEARWLKQQEKEGQEEEEEESYALESSASGVQSFREPSSPPGVGRDPSWQLEEISSLTEGSGLPVPPARLHSKTAPPRVHD